MSTTNEQPAKTATPETPEQKAARKAEKKVKKDAKKLQKLKDLLEGAGTDKPLRITDLNHVELAKALNDLEKGIDRIRTLLAQERK
ncbi:MAG: hypothetical protein IPP83_03050 [Flavobacteriales bacterium]|nr:hypothetical protein [Flavobacteriales bacterium]